MRLSVDKEDPGYTGPIRGLKVFLDGVEQKWVITADEEEGKVLTLVRLPDGNFARDGDELRQEWKSGKVELQFPASFPREQFEVFTKAR